MTGWMIALLVWLLAQPVLAVTIGGICAGGRREARVDEAARPVRDEPLTSALAR